MKTIFVLGFGRSGTTWISDIISKMTGYLILFEPFHPSVTKNACQFSYASNESFNSPGMLYKHICSVLQKGNRRMWLMRNHVPVPLDKISRHFLEKLWKECAILGFKEIRANFLIEWFVENFDAKIVFIARHPCAVVASIKNRPNFWEFGWPDTYELFLKKTIFCDNYRDHAIHKHKRVVAQAKSDISKYTVMWAITHAIVLPQLDKLGIPLFRYEDFYEQPFRSVKGLAHYLGNGSVHIHPSYIFTPSMTTLKTFHGLVGMEESVAQKSARLFWENQLDPREVEAIFEIVNAFGIGLYACDGGSAATAWHREKALQHERVAFQVGG